LKTDYRPGVEPQRGQSGSPSFGPSGQRRGLWSGIVAFGKAIWYGQEGEPEESVLAGGDEPPPVEYGPLDRWFTRFTKWMSYVAALALGIVTLVCFVDVITWKLFGWTVPSATDLVTYLNLVLVFMAAAYVQMDRGSVAIELLQNKFQKVVRLATRVFGWVLGAGVCLFAAYRGWFRLADMYNTNAMAEGAWHFRLWPFQAVLVFGFVCLGLAFLFAIGRDVTNFRKRRANFAASTVDATAEVSGQATGDEG